MIIPPPPYLGREGRGAKDSPVYGWGGGYILYAGYLGTPLYIGIYTGTILYTIYSVSCVCLLPSKILDNPGIDQDMVKD